MIQRTQRSRYFPTLRSNYIRLPFLSFEMYSFHITKNTETFSASGGLKDSHYELTGFVSGNPCTRLMTRDPVILQYSNNGHFKVTLYGPKIEMYWCIPGAHYDQPITLDLEKGTLALESRVMPYAQCLTWTLFESYDPKGWMHCVALA